MDLDDRKLSRLKSCFDHARKALAQEDCDRGYATDLLTQCVLGDPSNIEYMRVFWENLCRQYSSKKGSKLALLTGVAGRSSLKKTFAQKDWPTATKQAIELLKKYPWDTVALASLAAIARENELGEVEFHWLNFALIASPNDADVNRQCAQAMEKRGEYDQAIACWHRVEKAHPNDEEAAREISRLALAKTRVRGGYGEESSLGVDGARSGAKAKTQLSTEERLKQQITREPESVPLVLELAQLYVTEDRYAEAEETLKQAVKLSGNDLDVQERLDEVQRTMIKLQLAAAEKQAKATRKEADILRYQQILQEFRQREIEIYQARCERFTTNLTFKYELGLRYQQAKQYQEAIKQFQAAMTDPRQKGLCLLAMGECFQQIRQFNLAMKNFIQAIDALPERDVENKKLALLRTGKLALYRQEAEIAEKYLSELAQLDFGYRDVADMLEKLEKLRASNPAKGDGKKE